MNKLPQGWTAAPLDSLCQKLRGVSYKRDEASPIAKNGCLPILRANNIEADKLAFEELVWVPVNRVSDQQKLRRGDIVIAMSSGSKSVVGKTAQASTDWEGAFGAFCGLLRPSTELHSQFLGLFLRTREYRSQISELAAGSNINNLKNEHFAAIDVPVAPLNEQKKIVRKLEEVLDKVEASQKRLKKIPVLLKRFRQSILVAACSGRLTAEWREQNRITTEPERTTLELITEYIGGFAYKSPTFLKAGKHQVIRIGNVGAFALKRDASPVFISEDIAKETARFKLLANDIVISMTGTKYKRDYGVAAIVSDLDGSVFLNQRVGRLRCGDKILPKFLLYWLQTDIFRDSFFSSETGNVNQGNVGADGIRKAPIELPEMAEQQEIVRRVESLFSLADQIEARFRKGNAQVDKLTQSILAKAFRGELVPQDPTDEPASVLLERIKSENGKKSALKKTRGK